MKDYTLIPLIPDRCRLPLITGILLRFKRNDLYLDIR